MGKKKNPTPVPAPAVVTAATTAAAIVPPEAKPPVKRVPALEVPRITRMEEEERKILSEALYQSELDKIATRDDQITFVRQTNSEKIQGFKKFAALMGDPVNKRVLRIFAFVTLMMFSVPVVALYFGMHVLAPALGMESEKDTVGGLFAVGTTVVIMVGYVVFALGEDEVFNESVQLENMAARNGKAPTSSPTPMQLAYAAAVKSSKQQEKKAKAKKQ